MMRIWMKALIVCLLVLILGVGLFLKFIDSVQVSKMLTVHSQSLTQIDLNNPFMGLEPPAVNGRYMERAWARGRRIMISKQLSAV